MKKKHNVKSVDQINLKILNELINFCMHHGASDLDIKIKDNPSEIYIQIHTTAEGIDENTIKTLKKYLSAPRQHEVESYYWELSGEDEADSELTLVGMMTDEAEVSYEEGKLEIRVKRKK
ncbi:hypothetical protein [Clostridium polynesiense]|uniref:hypothetical protein n=1 Tax=Clostridium polynesiense TaxID=1325933 RepID=UPI00058DF332|nr:hypothetical protein [Clostridium polynesiense]